MNCKLPCCPAGIIALVSRVSIGLSLLFVGLVHYMTFTSFLGMVTEDLGYWPIAALGTVWAYVLPALMIVGGALLVLGMFEDIAVWAASLAIGSIPAGMLFKSVLSGVPLSTTMTPAINALFWLVALILVVKLQSCCCEGDGSCCAKK